MVERRNLMGGGLVAGLTALMAPDMADAAAQRGDDQEVARAVEGLRQAVENRFDNLQFGPWRRITQLREQQRVWMRSAQKFPDFIEIGIEVWESVYDWHVRYQQPVSMTRMTDGRYAMVFMFTTLILRTDANPDFIGIAFDADTRRP